MSDTLLGLMVRDRRSGIVGRVIGRVEWMDQPPSLVVQPLARPDQTVPPSTYVVEAAAEVLPQPVDPSQTVQ